MTGREPAAVSLAELNAFLASQDWDPPVVKVVDLAKDWVLARIPTSEVKTRPGGYVPGPTMMGGVDYVGWILTFTRAGITPMALTWDLKINFLRPAHGADVMIDARQTKFGKLCHATMDLYLDGDRERLVAHATTTYAMPE